MIEDAVKARLRADSELKKITSTRIDTDEVNNHNDKYVMISVVDDEDEFDSSNKKGQSSARIQIDCYAKNKTIVRDMRKAIDASLQQQSFSINNLHIQVCMRESRVPTSEKKGASVLYREALDYNIKYNEV
ncbi:hypothetical protein KUL42_32530 [Alteromonas sp. KUL42]|uniref:tail completion protein gp17 n=1 Tax=Alteromonas sp. KUL42 TaxID=2480797 RepID=UPI001036ECE3|nr:DUF3168 domain-containing protein [Alteromonas sp. KUL42]TAP33273.1 DUF3168 domain-containing protein [Alteromonas sp. KUL42]GEA08492.1 hypothetical protein KUL42_32530 [Alteromonas sp. KUL42]